MRLSLQVEQHESDILTIIYFCPAIFPNHSLPIKVLACKKNPWYSLSFLCLSLDQHKTQMWQTVNLKAFNTLRVTTRLLDMAKEHGSSTLSTHNTTLVFFLHIEIRVPATHFTPAPQVATCVLLQILSM